MKTSIELDEEKLKLARKLSALKSNREIVDKALDAFIAEAKRRALADMLGTPFFEGSLTKMRKRGGNSRR